MTPKAITDMVLKKRYRLELKPSCPHDTPARYELGYCEQNEQRFSKSYQLTVTKLQNKIISKKLLIVNIQYFGLKSGEGHCHTAKLKPNRVTIDQVPLVKD
jgi:hypothetical protein